MSERLSEHAIWSVVEDPTTSRSTTIDIGAQTNNSAYVSMKSFARCMLQVELGTYNGTDELDQCKIQQATTSTGTNVKDLTTSAAAGNYDTGSKIGSDGDFVVVEVRGEDLDSNATATVNPFDFLRALVTEDSDTGQDDCFALLLRYGSSYLRKELQGAASATQVYVDTGT